MTKEMVNERLEKLAQAMEANDSPGSYAYRAKTNDWVKGAHDRTYLKVVEYRISGTKWIRRKEYDYGYLNNLTGEYVPGQYDLNDDIYDIGEWIIDDVPVVAAEPTESIRKTAIVNAFEAAVVEDAKIYREKGIPEEKIEKMVNALKKITDIISNVSTEGIDDVFWGLDPHADVKEIGKKVLARIRVFGPRTEEQKNMKDQILAAMAAVK